jgi:hypothetical protein
LALSGSRGPEAMLSGPDRFRKRGPLPGLQQENAASDLPTR